MKIKPEAIDKVLAPLFAGTDPNITWTPLADVTKLLAEATGIEVTDKDVARAVKDEPSMFKLGKRDGESVVYYERPEKRAVRKRADDLAAALGGVADHWSDERVATITLTIAQAEAMLKRIATFTNPPKTEKTSK